MPDADTSGLHYLARKQCHGHVPNRFECLHLTHVHNLACSPSASSFFFGEGKDLSDNRDHATISCMESVIVEIRAGEGGADAKALVREQFAVYARLIERSGL